jgi:hypothetical protein
MLHDLCRQEGDTKWKIRALGMVEKRKRQVWVEKEIL